MSGGPGIKFFRLWERESKNGRRYFAGYIGLLNVVIFKDEQATPRPSVIAEWQAFANEGMQSPQRPPPDAGGIRGQHQTRQPSTSISTAPRPARIQRSPEVEAVRTKPRPEPGDGQPWSDDLSDIGGEER